MTIADLKVGAKLVFGTYGVTTAANPITWLKASKDNEFISEYVLDTLRFDAREPANPDRSVYWYGNSDYELSNIIQFMNSCDEDWYGPTHEYDAPPGRESNFAISHGDYRMHAGFLNGFEDYELDSLAGRIDLPTFENIYGGNGVPKFSLFNRKGFRGRASADLIHNRNGVCLTEAQYVSYWTRSAANTHQVYFVGASGQRSLAHPDNYLGFRPKCKLKPETKVESMNDGTFRIIPYEAVNRRTTIVCTDEEFMSLMGLL